MFLNGETTLTGLHTSADIEYVRQQLSAGNSPWSEALTRLESSNYAKVTYTASPVEYLARLDANNWKELNWRWENAGIADLWYDGIYVNYTNLMRDAAAAYQLALRYQILQDKQYADAAKKILTDWASTNKGLLRNSAGELIDPNEFLILIQAHQLAAAAQLLRISDDWQSTDDFAKVCTWLKSTFYVPASDFLVRHNDTTDHYWLNWDLACMNAILSIGIVSDDAAMQAEAIDYFKSGNGVGNIAKAVPYVYDDPDGTGEKLGQCNESGRDQGHATLCASLLGTFCQMANGIGEDLFAYDNYRAVAMAEYIAKYNVKDGDAFKYDASSLPFTSYYYCSQQMDAISDNSRGTVRPGWDIWVGYCNKNGLPCKYANEMAANDRPDAGGGSYGSNSGGFDQLGFSTLMAYRAVVPAVWNVTTETEYASLVDAWGSAAESDEILVYKDQTLSDRLVAGKALTVAGNDEDVTVTRSAANKIIFLANAANKTLTLTDLTLDGANGNSSVVFIEASGNGSVALNNVTVQNAKITGNNGFIYAKSNGKVAINGLKAVDCTVDEGRGVVRIGNSNSTISGDVDASIFLDGTNYITVSGDLTNDTPIALYIDSQTEGAVIVKGCSDTSKFTLNNSNYVLTASNGNLVLKNPTAAQLGIVASDLADAPVEYFNLQGLRIDNPANGIFIRRQGSSVAKVTL
jgi:hypothetical protein